MKKLVLLMLLAVLATTCFGSAATSINIATKPTADWFANGGIKDLGWRWMQEADALLAIGESIGTGTIFYVDSDVTNKGDGSNWLNAKETIEEAYDLCTGNAGDVILIAQGHSETLGTLVLDTEGVTIIGIGTGEDRPEIIWDDTGDIITISAASNTLVNLAFRAGVHAVVTAIDITADGDYTTIWACEFPEPSSSAYDFITAIQLTTASDNVTIAKCIYKHADAVGPAEFIDGGTGIVQGLSIVGNHIYGEFSVAPIFSDQDDTECYIAGNVITNITSSQYGIKLTGNSTGWIIGNWVSTDAIGTSYNVGRLSDSENYWDDFNVYDTTAIPWTTNETGVNRWGVTELAQIEGEVTDALEADHLDHFFAVSVAGEIVNDSYAADIAASDGDWSGFDKATDSLEAIRDKIDTLSGIGFRGTITATGAATLMTTTDLAGFGDDFFNTGWRAICTYDQGAVGAAPEGEIRDIVDYISTSGIFTVDAWSTALVVGDKVYVRRIEELNLDHPTMLRGSGNIWYVDAGRAGTPDVYEEGRSWTNAYTTITGALDAATENNGDVIYVAAGHSEAVGAAYAFDDHGISIIGIGEGDLQPTMSFDTGTDAQIDVTASDILIENIKFEAALADLIFCFDVATTGDGLHIKKCRFVSTGTGTEFLIAVHLQSGADDVIIEDSEFLALGTDATECIKPTGVVDNLQIIGNYIEGDYVVAAIWSDQTLTSALIKDNIVRQDTSGQHAIEFTTASSALGLIVNNSLYTNDYATILDPGSMNCIGNVGTDAIDEQSIAIPLSAATSDIVADEDGSILERLEMLQAKQTPRMELKYNSDMTGYDTVAWFTVTGDVLVRVIGVVGDTQILSTSGTTTLMLGTTEDEDSIIASTQIDNGDFDATDVWVDNNPEDDSAVMGTTDWVVIGGGADIILTRNVDDLTQGKLTLYCWWIPLSADGDVMPN